MSYAKELFVGLIPDGGRRAVNNDPFRYEESYQRGAKVVGDMLKLCVQDARVKIFAAWGLSDDNALRRPGMQLDILNNIFVQYLQKLRKDLQEPDYENVKVVHLGNAEFLTPQVNDLIADIVRFTNDRSEKIFGLCLGHGAEDEMERAADRRGERRANGEQCKLVDCLDLPTRGGILFKPVDLIVRTGTDPNTPYTSGYMLPYQVRGGTQEKYYSEFLPNVPASTILDAVDYYEQRMLELRKGK